MKITIKTNRIFFERFEVPCGDTELKEIKSAWESAAINAIEKAGYEANIGIGVGYDPAVRTYISINGVCLGWNSDGREPNAARTISKNIAGGCYGEECDCDEPIEALMTNLIPIVLRDARRVIDDALEVADNAAKNLSDEFVAASK
jgi:hypothetical protein